MKVLQSEKCRILHTTNYDMFSYPKFKIRLNTIKDLMNDIERKNLNKDMPIIVDDEYNILDGRHVFLALKQMGLEVHYKIAEVAERLDFLIAKKYAKKATPFDFCVHHKERYSYRFILNYVKETHFSFMEVFNQLNIGTNHRSREYKSFQEGLWEIEKESVQELKNVKKISETIKSVSGLYSNDMDDYDVFRTDPPPIVKKIFEYFQEFTDLFIEANGLDVTESLLFSDLRYYFYKKLLYRGPGHLDMDDRRTRTEVCFTIINILREKQDYEMIKEGMTGFDLNSWKQCLEAQKEIHEGSWRRNNFRLSEGYYKFKYEINKLEELYREMEEFQS